MSDVISRNKPTGACTYTCARAIRIVKDPIIARFIIYLSRMFIMLIRLIGLLIIFMGTFAQNRRTALINNDINFNMRCIWAIEKERIYIVWFIVDSLYFRSIILHKWRKVFFSGNNVWLNLCYRNDCRFLWLADRIVSNGIICSLFLFFSKYHHLIAQRKKKILMLSFRIYSSILQHTL